MCHVPLCISRWWRWRSWVKAWRCSRQEILRRAVGWTGGWCRLVRRADEQGRVVSQEQQEQCGASLRVPRARRPSAMDIAVHAYYQDPPAVDLPAWALSLGLK